MPKPLKQKKIKAFVVIYNGEINGNIRGRYDIYMSKSHAHLYKREINEFDIDAIVIPCTISYSLPTNQQKR